jgi:hypothetical protein
VRDGRGVLEVWGGLVGCGVGWCLGGGCNNLSLVHPYFFPLPVFPCPLSWFFPPSWFFLLSYLGLGFGGPSTYFTLFLTFPYLPPSFFNLQFNFSSNFFCLPDIPWAKTSWGAPITPPPPPSPEKIGQIPA